VQQATEQYEGFGLFLRAMTGLDYEAAAIAFAGVRSSQTLTPQQDDHLEPLIEMLAKNGTAKVADLYEITVHAASARSRGSVHRCTDRCHRGGLAGHSNEGPATSELTTRPGLHANLPSNDSDTGRSRESQCLGDHAGSSCAATANDLAAESSYRGAHFLLPARPGERDPLPSLTWTRSSGGT
jgi:hypothetical protein